MHAIAPRARKLLLLNLHVVQLTLGASLFSAVLCAFAAGPDATSHTTTELFAALGAILTEARHKPRTRSGGNGTAQQEIG